MDEKTIIYKVNGMHCASCASYIESSLMKDESIKSVMVNVATDTCKVEFVDSPKSLQELNSKIKNAGYELSPRINGAMEDMEGMDHSMGVEFDNSAKVGINLDLKITLILTALSFLMIIFETLIQLKIVPEMSLWISELIHHILPIAATFVIITQGKIYMKALWNFVKSGHANMDTLVGIGVITAFIYSFIITAFEIPLRNIVNTSGGFYDISIILIGLIGLGKYLESNSKRKTTEAVRKLIELSSKSALIKQADGTEIEKDISEIKVGDIAIIKVGMNVPVDGEIISGSGNFDESSITGESVPVRKEINAKVFAGTNLKNGFVEVKASQIGTMTKLGKITKLVENAMMSKAPIQKLADKISGYFTYFVLILAVLTSIAWIIYGYISGDQILSTKLAITSFISILVVACPCALGLATPLAIAKGIGEAAKKGILFKNAESIQKIKDVDILIFDKTGTLTNGKFEIAKFDILDKSISKFEVDTIMQILESKSIHPIASLFTSNNNHIQKELSDVSISNNGISGKIEGIYYQAGNAKFVGIVNDLKFEDIGTQVYLKKNDVLIAKFLILDKPKENIGIVLENLRKLKIKTVLATGDKKVIGEKIGIALGFEIENIFTELHPEDKLEIIKKFQKEGKVVAMFGDGINDSPALALSDVGVAMGDGSEIALDTADVAIVNGDMDRLPDMFKISKSTFLTIKQNLFWAFSYNIIMIPIATGIFFLPFGILLSPVFDAISMSFSSLAVAINSQRLKLK